MVCTQEMALRTRATPTRSRRASKILRLEQLGERIVPAAVRTVWTNGLRTGRWSDAGNWDNGLPDASKVAVLQPVQSVSGTITLDNTVQAANRVVAGLTTENGYAGTLSLTSGLPLTVSSLTNDTTTGFKWSTQASISQSTASDVLIITGGGSADYNKWSGGTIGSTTVQSEVDVIGQTTLQITENASALGDNLIVGDPGGGSTLEFYNQRTTLQVNNNAGILVSDNADDQGPPTNRLLFDTDVT